MRTFKQTKQEIYTDRKCFDTVLDGLLKVLEKKDLDYEDRVYAIKVIKNTIKHKNEHEDVNYELYELMGENKGILIGAAAFAGGMFIGKVITTILCRK